MAYAARYGRVSVDDKGKIIGSGGNIMSNLYIVELDGIPVGTTTKDEFERASAARRVISYQREPDVSRRLNL